MSIKNNNNKTHTYHVGISQLGKACGENFVYHIHSCEIQVNTEHRHWDIEICSHSSWSAFA